MKTGYYITRKGAKIEFNKLKEPIRKLYNDIGLEANKYGYELRVRVGKGGNYEGNFS